MTASRGPARGPVVTAKATEWLIDRGVKVMGIDQWGWDMPLKAQAELAKKTGNRKIFWEATVSAQEKNTVTLSSWST